MGDFSPLDRMQQLLRHWDLSLDARAIFLRCYAMMTENMLAAVPAGTFEDGSWVSRLLEHFAVYYFAALAAYEEDSSQTPLVWQVAFDAARQPGTHALQNLVLGVNAHINFDLVFAVADLLESEWVELEPARKEVRHRDYRRVNEIISATIDAVQDQVLEQWSPAMSLVDDWLGSFDEWFVTRRITNWRDQVWEEAVHYVELPTVSDRQELRREVETASLERASAILGNEGLLGYLKAL